MYWGSILVIDRLYVLSIVHPRIGPRGINSYVGNCFFSRAQTMVTYHHYHQSTHSASSSPSESYWGVAVRYAKANTIWKCAQTSFLLLELMQISTALLVAPFSMEHILIIVIGTKCISNHSAIFRHLHIYGHELKRGSCQQITVFVTALLW